MENDARFMSEQYKNGQEKRKLHFVCVGAQKAGTTTLHDILNQHPKIGLPVVKESHFFSKDEQYSKGLHFYFKYYFSQRKKELMYGEVNPEFSYDQIVSERLKEHFKELKIIMIIRNPVDRAFSQYLMTKRRGLEPLSFEEAMEKENDRLVSPDGHMNYSYAARGKYCEQIKRYQDLFGKGSVKIILFEDFVRATPEKIQEICEFIDAPDFTFDFTIKSNQASESRSKLLRDFLYQPNPVKKVLGKLVYSQKIKDRIAVRLDKANLKQGKKERISNKLKEKIYHQYFKSEIESLETLLKKDLSHWKTYEHNI